MTSMMATVRNVLELAQFHWTWGPGQGKAIFKHNNDAPEHNCRESGLAWAGMTRLPGNKWICECHDVFEQRRALVQITSLKLLKEA